MPWMSESNSLFVRIVGVFRRVFPRCGMLSQAIAFNLFLAFFPTMLFAVGFASIWLGPKAATSDAIREFTSFLPPGSESIVSDFLSRRGTDIWKYAALGGAGLLFGGAQVMTLLMEGIHLIYGEDEPKGFVRRQLRGLLLLLITIAPILGAGILGVFGRQIRHWLTQELGQEMPVHLLWLAFFPLVAMVLAMLALTGIYWVARSTKGRLGQVLPGAAAATSMWWVVNAAFGFYMRRVPYSIVYGGLAAVIGLLVWMQISSVVVFLGAAWNAQLALEREEVPVLEPAVGVAARPIG
jgi:membrane protein